MFHNFCESCLEDDAIYRYDCQMVLCAECYNYSINPVELIFTPLFFCECGRVEEYIDSPQETFGRCIKCQVKSRIERLDNPDL